MAEEIEDIPEYKEKVVDAEIITNTDIKINPDYYIHMAFVLAQRALNKENLKEGYLAFRIHIETAEAVAKGANKLEDEYYDRIKEFIDSEEYKNQEVDIKSIKLAQKKLELLMEQMFKHKPIIDQLPA